MAKTTNVFKTTKTSSPGSSTTSEQMSKLITKKAYELWEKRGRVGGHELDDWLEAERIVKGKSR